MDSVLASSAALISSKVMMCGPVLQCGSPRARKALPRFSDRRTAGLAQRRGRFGRTIVPLVSSSNAPNGIPALSMSRTLPGPLYS